MNDINESSGRNACKQCSLAASPAEEEASDASNMVAYL